MRHFTLAQFEAEFPDEWACLRELFKKRYGNMEWCPKCGCEAKFYHVRNRRSFACTYCRYQVYPTAGTVMHNTHIPLRTWFYVIYLMSVSRNGVGATEVERMTGISYVSALRMTRQIRKAMDQGTELLEGIVEADEAYIGGRRRTSIWRSWKDNKTPLLGAVERGGRVRVKAVEVASKITVQDFITKNIKTGSQLQTDESYLYKWSEKTYNRVSVRHGKFEYVREDAYTNTIEGFWGNFKPYLNGTFRSVSKKYLQLYVDEAVWKYNHRKQSCLYFSLLEAVAPQATISCQNAFVGS
jgi:transposase